MKLVFSLAQPELVRQSSETDVPLHKGGQYCHDHGGILDGMLLLPYYATLDDITQKVEEEARKERAENDPTFDQDSFDENDNYKYDSVVSSLAVWVELGVVQVNDLHQMKFALVKPELIYQAWWTSDDFYKGNELWNKYGAIFFTMCILGQPATIQQIINRFDYEVKNNEEFYEWKENNDVEDTILDSLKLGVVEIHPKKEVVEPEVFADQTPLPEPWAKKLGVEIQPKEEELKEVFADQTPLPKPWAKTKGFIRTITPFVVVFGMFGCGFGLIAWVECLRSSNKENRIIRLTNSKNQFLQQNDSKVRVLVVLSDRVIVEGSKTKERKSIYCGNMLLAPGDVCVLNVDGDGDYQFVNKE